ncbi:HNH endonuclease signature motif containing protein [Bacillus smithii]|uniref:HNH endonuclease signature motif containing protein n=1 Tax=Bacillus smithii TaxID=1479 RepID=UPI002E22C30F|nr:HNH endonuclease signature motif containing protein [Bacillus smithii]MED1456640.1 HNH endonuclease signature motif containing protein [Bacillus smithii]
MTPEIRKKLRESRLGTGEGKSYEKTYGRHTHRIVAEQKLGRKLLPGEVVHHIDGNIRNNNPENLMIFPSQKEHAEWHAKYGWFMYGISFGKGGGAE